VVAADDGSRYVQYSKEVQEGSTELFNHRHAQVPWCIKGRKPISGEVVEIIDVCMKENMAKY
jgi:hypothetical protein